MSAFFQSGHFVGLEAKLRLLATDIAYLQTVGAPDPDDLRDAPILDAWRFALLPTRCLVGSVTGHPLLGNSPLMHTTPIFASDVEAGWVRTLSRFYRLGRREGSLPEGGGHA